MEFNAIIGKLARAGVEIWPVEEHRRLIITNLTGYLAALSSISYALTYALYDFAALWPVAVGNLAVTVVYLAIPLWHRVAPTAGGVVLAITIFCSIFFFIWFLSRNSGIQLNYLGAAAVAFAVFGIKRLGLVTATVAVGLGMHFIAHFWFITGHAVREPEQWFIDQLYVLSAGSITLIVGVVVWYAFKLAADAEERSERLLRNVLPDTIAERLKVNPQQSIAERHENTTVLFADIVGFMDLSRANDAETVVGLLNKLFVAFDKIGADLGSEKIKTIGDAYMAVAGLPDENARHAHIIAEQALQMMDACHQIAEETGTGLNLRIGIATGPVLAGVIGQAKFAYDVWGDTVNFAARLESHGSPGRIHICDNTRQLAGDEYECRPAPARQIKGVGKATTWFLETRSV